MKWLKTALAALSLAVVAGCASAVIPDPEVHISGTTPEAFMSFFNKTLAEETAFRKGPSYKGSDRSYDVNYEVISKTDTATKLKLTGSSVKIKDYGYVHGIYYAEKFGAETVVRSKYSFFYESDNPPIEYNIKEAVYFNNEVIMEESQKMLNLLKVAFESGHADRSNGAKRPFAFEW